MYLGNKGLSRRTVVIALCLLAGIIVLIFSQFVEQSRATEVENIINLAVAAQERQYMRKGKYAMNWNALDIAPIAPHLKKVGKYISQNGLIYLTAGKGDFDNPSSGFKMYFEKKGDTIYLVAERHNWRYDYTLVRSIRSDKTLCIPSAGPKAAADKSFCADFMVLDNKDDFPPDPRDQEEEEQESPYW